MSVADLDRARQRYRRDPAYRALVRRRVWRLMPAIGTLVRLDAVETRLQADWEHRAELIGSLAMPPVDLEADDRILFDALNDVASDDVGADVEGEEP